MEKWLFMTDVRLISYLFICLCESNFRAAKNSFLTNCTCSMSPLSLILFSNNEQQSVEVQQMTGERWECTQVIRRRKRWRKCQYIVPYTEATVFLVHIHYLLPLLQVHEQDCSQLSHQDVSSKWYVNDELISSQRHWCEATDNKKNDYRTGDKLLSWGLKATRTVCST